MNKLMIILGFILVMPLLTGCIDESTQVNGVNLVMKDKGDYKKTIIKVEAWGDIKEVTLKISTNASDGYVKSNIHVDCFHKIYCYKDYNKDIGSCFRHKDIIDMYCNDTIPIRRIQ